jgi:hypothetical protein
MASNFCPISNKRGFPRPKLKSSNIRFHENHPKEPCSSVRTDGRVDEKTGEKVLENVIFGFAAFQTGL